MRVIISTIDYPPPPGGIQTVTKNLEKGLSEKGVEGKVIYENTESSRYNIRDYIPRVRRLYSVKDVLNRKYVFDNYLFRKTICEIRKKRPGIVHSMHIRGWGSILAAKKENIPTIVSVHAKELKNERLASRVLEEADAIHCPSNFTKNLVRGLPNGKSLQKKSYIIPPSIRKKYYEKKEYRRKVTCIARHVKRKNIEKVIEAWKVLEESMDREYNLYIVGNGPLKEKLIKLSEGVETIHFTGWIDEEEKRKLLEESDLFVLTPTQIGYDAEGFGIVYLEAQAAGTPIVASKTGGVPEAVGEAGIFVENEMSETEIAEGMKKVLKNNRLKSEISKRAKKRIKNFSVKKIVQKHIEKYEKISR
jgi:phosphatidylinositol alpha-1,6-mannosyltransferase